MLEELVADTLEKQDAIAIANVGISVISFDIVHFFYLRFSHLIFPLFFRNAMLAEPELM